MNEPRNPFALGRSESIDSDSVFLQLFEPVILDVFPTDDLFAKIHIIRSAPGGGKTSLLRLFTPGVLQALYSYRSSEAYKDLYSQLVGLGAFDENGPQLLGVMLSCSRAFADFEDLPLEPRSRARLLTALLNAKILLAALRGALALRQRSFPRDLGLVTFNVEPDTAPTLDGQPFPTAGPAVYAWAQRVEREVYDAANSFRPLVQPPPGHEELFSLRLIGEGRLRVEGAPVARHSLLMIDNVHELTARQREHFLQLVFADSMPRHVWFAERLSALPPTEMLNSGAVTGRDNVVILLEEFWRERRRRLEKLLLNIADRRSRYARDTDVHEFAPHLEDSLDGVHWSQAFVGALRSIEERVRVQAAARPTFSEWVASRATTTGTPRERATAWRVLEILMARELRDSQMLLEMPLSEDELLSKDDSSVSAAAELFLAREAGVPYYYGPTTLASLASFNIEQFLRLAGGMFEELISAALIRQPSTLRADRQERVLEKAVRERWLDVPNRVEYGRDVQRLLDAIGEFSRWQTYLPNAPYAPGVTGIGITMVDRDVLRNPVGPMNHEYEHLSRVISAALSHNLLEAYLDVKCKGKTWMLLYLNRSLCVRFQLPLQYGGWRPKNLRDLAGWLQSGFRVPSGGSLL